MKHKYVIKKNKLIILLIIMLSTRFFYLFPDYVFKASINCENIMVLLSLGWSLLVLLNKPQNNKRIKYAWVGVIALLLVITSSFQGHFLYSGQSIIDGISLQKYFISGILLFFAITKEIKQDKLSFQDIVDVCFWCSCLHMGIYFLQFFLGSNHLFLSCYYITPALDDRVIRIRLYGSCHTITFSLIFCVNEFVSGSKKKRTINLIYIVATTVFAILVLQGRSNILTVLAIILSGFVVNRTKGSRRLFVLLIAIIAFAYVWETGYIQQIISEYLSTTTETHSTMAVRVRSQEYYLYMLRKHLLLGGGYADSSISAAALLSGQTNGYLIGDNGIYGFLFRYGLLGLLWAIPVLCIFIVKGIQFRNNGSAVLIMKVIAILVGIINSTSWFDGFGVIYTMLFFTYIEFIEHQALKQEQVATIRGEIR